METLGVLIRAMLAIGIVIGIFLLMLTLIQYCIVNIFNISFTLKQSFLLWCLSGLLFNWNTKEK